MDERSRPGGRSGARVEASSGLLEINVAMLTGDRTSVRRASKNQDPRYRIGQGVSNWGVDVNAPSSAPPWAIPPDRAHSAINLAISS